MKRNIYLIILILIGCHSLNAQRLTYSQLTKKVSNLTVPEDRSVLVFESDLDLSFKSSMERLVAPVKKGNLYYVTVTERICIITVINNVTKSEVVLPFGQLSENTLPTIPKGEYILFKIEENIQELIVFNQTEIKKKEGLNDNQMLYEKEALLILNVDPFDLELEFESTQAITDVKHSGKQYKIYIKPVKQEIIVKQKESDAQGIIQIQHLEPKEVQYYYVSLPEHLRKREVIYDKNISVGDYLIESVPSGAVIEIFGNPSFNSEKNRTPYLLKGFEAGYKVITLSLPEYETINDTIQIGSNKKNKSHYDLIPQFAFINIDIEPPFPYPSLYVDNQPYSAQNKQNIKIPVSSKEIEIKAQHFESETLTINPTPGEVIYVKKKLNPILGKLYLECGKNAEKGKVYISNPKLNIDRKLLGTLPIQEALILQEGQYELTVERKGYGVYKKTIQITKQQLSKETISLGLTKKVKITTDTNIAAIYIDGHYVGKTGKIVNLTVGSHEITVIQEGYENYHEKIDVTAHVDSIHIFLKINPILLKVEFYDGNAQGGKLDVNSSLYVDDIFISELKMGKPYEKDTLPLYLRINDFKNMHHFRLKNNLNSSTFSYKAYKFPANFTKQQFVFQYSAPYKMYFNGREYTYYNFISYSFIKAFYGLVVNPQYQIDSISNPLINKKKCYKVEFINTSDSTLSFFSTKRIYYINHQGNKYTLFLQNKNQELTITENGTGFSTKISFKKDSKINQKSFLFKINKTTHLSIVDIPKKKCTIFSFWDSHSPSESEWIGYSYFLFYKMNLKVVFTKSGRDIIAICEFKQANDYGKYSLIGFYDVNQNQYIFSPNKWIVKPESRHEYSLLMAGFSGVFLNDSVFAGKIDVWGGGGREIYLEKKINRLNVRTNAINVSIGNHKIYARISNADDKAIMYINNVKVITTNWGEGNNGNHPGTSGWIDVSSYLKKGNNKIRLYVWNNSGCCGVSGKFEMKMNEKNILLRDFSKQSSNEGVYFDETIDLIINE